MSKKDAAKRPHPLSITFVTSVVISCVRIITALELADKHLDDLVEEPEDRRPQAVSVTGAGALIDFDRRNSAHVNGAVFIYCNISGYGVNVLAGNYNCVILGFFNNKCYLAVLIRNAGGYKFALVIQGYGCALYRCAILINKCDVDKDVVLIRKHFRLGFAAAVALILNVAFFFIGRFFGFNCDPVVSERLTGAYGIPEAAVTGISGAGSDCAGCLRLGGCVNVVNLLELSGYIEILRNI